MVLTLLPTAAFAADKINEQFSLAPGGRYRKGDPAWHRRTK